MISQAGEYALRSIVYLSQLGLDKPASAGQIAEATKVPRSYLQKILRTLTQHQLLIAQRGIGGGFRLAKLPSAISVLDVLKACDSGPDRIERCPLGIQGHTHLCALHKLIDEQTARVENVFAGTSIADLFDNESGLLPLCKSDHETSVALRVDKPKPQ